MTIDNYKIEGMTMAVTNMDEMLAFYSKIFEIKFEEKEMFNAKLYSGVWGGLSLLFCPAEVAQNKATQNRHQFDIVTFDIQKLINKVNKSGGHLMGEVAEDESSLSVGVYDPDNNSILFKQIKE